MSSWSRISFPRTRGDGPFYLPGTVPLLKLPPHARGWTPRIALPDPWYMASPARAGMDPRTGRRCGGRHGFPRTRGDGPLVVTAIGVEGELPPHARGWTP